MMNQTRENEGHAPVSQILIGGFAGTIVITLMMYFGASMMIGAPMDLAGELARMVGVPWVLGMVIHFVLGTVVFSCAYALLASRMLSGGGVLSGLVWGVSLWLVAMLIMSPMMGKSLFMGAMPSAMASLVGHIAYGLTLGKIIGLAK